VETVAEQKLHPDMKYPLNDREQVSKEIAETIKEYYTIRNYVWPTVDEALKWHEAEMGEVYELLLAQVGGWVRNHPEDHPPYSDEAFEEEIGDAIFMLLVAGIKAGLDPLGNMLNKMILKANMVKKFSVIHIAHQLTMDVILTDIRRFSFGLWLIKLGCIICGMKLRITKNPE